MPTDTSKKESRSRLYKALRLYFLSKGDMTERKVAKLVERWIKQKGLKFPPGYS